MRILVLQAKKIPICTQLVKKPKATEQSQRIFIRRYSIYTPGK